MPEMMDLDEANDLIKLLNKKIRILESSVEHKDIAISELLTAIRKGLGELDDD